MKKLLFSFGLLALAGAAPAVEPNLSSVDPIGIQRGSETELRFVGRRLDDVVEVLFHDNDVKVQEIKEVKDRMVTVRVKVAPDARVGEHQVRLRARTGISDLRTFYIGPFKQIEEQEKKSENNTLEAAEALAGNITVLGKITTEDVDHYVIQCKKGDKISAEVEAMRLGRSMFDPYVAILDDQGKLLTRADDTALFLQDTFVTAIAPKDGRYYIQVRETSFLGRNDQYRLHVGNFPRPNAVYPPGGKAGQSLDVTFIGDAGGSIGQSVLLPEEYNPRLTHGVFAERGGVSSPSPNPVMLAQFANVLEKEPNDELATATVHDGSLPIAFNGIIAKENDTDWFKFTAKKGQNLNLHAYARRVRSPLDTALYVHDAKGRQVAGNTDAGGADSRVNYRIPADGEYFVRIFDELKGFGPDFTYRIEITEPAPDVYLNIADTRRYDAQTRKYVVVARGNRFASLMNLRRENFRGDLDFGIENFPKGVKLVAGPLPDGQNNYPIVFEAAADAPLGATLGNITVSTPKDAKEQIKGGIWQEYVLIQDGNRGSYHETWSDKIAAVVVEKLPFKLHLAQPRAALVRYGALDLKVTVEREKDFDQAIRLYFLYNPPGVGTSSFVDIAKGKNEATYTLNGNGNAGIGKWKITILGETTISEGRAWASTELVDLDVADYFVGGKLSFVTTTPGKGCKIVCTLEQKSPFDGTAKLELIGLPAGVTAEPVSVTKDSKEAVFDLKVSDQARLGMHRTLFCRLNLAQNGEEIQQNLAFRGALRIDPAAKLVAQAPVGK